MEGRSCRLQSTNSQVISSQMNQDLMTEESLERFYSLIERLRMVTGGARTLSSCTKNTGWPDRGVYFFFDSSEHLNDGRPRVVRVGTHAITDGSSTTLWQRLGQHRGSTSRVTGGPGGNHRGSVFRRHVGDAIIASDSQYKAIATTWGVGSNASREIRNSEQPLELAVSRYIGSLSVLWLAVLDDPSPTSDRTTIERNVISLLSSAQATSRFSVSSRWLGRISPSMQIKSSGLWNVRHVGGKFEAASLDLIEKWLVQMDGGE